MQTVVTARVRNRDVDRALDAANNTQGFEQAEAGGWLAAACFVLAAFFGGLLGGMMVERELAGPRERALDDVAQMLAAGR